MEYQQRAGRLPSPEKLAAEALVRRALLEFRYRDAEALCASAAYTGKPDHGTPGIRIPGDQPAETLDQLVTRIYGAGSLEALIFRVHRCSVATFRRRRAQRQRELDELPLPKTRRRKKTSRPPIEDKGYDAATRSHWVLAAGFPAHALPTRRS